MKKLKEIKWENGKYGTIYGYVDKKVIFSIFYKEKENYKLEFEYFKINEDYSLAQGQESLKYRANKVLEYFVNSFYREKI